MKPEKVKGVLLWSTFFAWLCVSAWIPYVFYAHGLEDSTLKPTAARAYEVKVVLSPQECCVPLEPPKVKVTAKSAKNTKNRITRRPKETPNQKLSDKELLDLYEKYKSPTMTKEIFLSIVHHESLGNTGLVSNKNAIGLMGVMGTTKDGRNVWLKQLKKEGILEKETDLYDPAKNIRAGMYAWDTFYTLNKGDVHKTLKQYTGSSKLARKYVAKADSLKGEADVGSEQHGGNLGENPTDVDNGCAPVQSGQIPQAAN